MSSLQERFEAKVDRSGNHHIWTGSKRSDGTGHIKINGRPVASRRVAWEVANGALPPDAQVKSCPDNKACVRVDHLSAVGLDQPAGDERQRRRASGSGHKPSLT